MIEFWYHLSSDFMVLLKIQKRDANSINNAFDFNPSVFRYFADGSEIKMQSVRDGLKSAFLGMLDNVVLPDENLFDELGEWSFNDPVELVSGVGGQTTVTNTYTGTRYIYRQAVETIITPAVNATLGSYSGDTYKYDSFALLFGGNPWQLESNLSRATHGKISTPEYQGFFQYGGSAPYPGFEGDEIDPPEPARPANVGTYIGLTYVFRNGAYELEPDLNFATHGVIINVTYQELTYWGGTLPIAAIVNTAAAGFYPVTGLEVGTHGMDGSDYRPLAFWNETFEPPVSGVGEFKGRLIESKTGFMLDSEKISLTLTNSGEALSRYNPIDLITFVALIKLQYMNRDSMTYQAEI